MTTTAARYWFDEPVDVTPEREQRHCEWVAAYAKRVRDTWAANGEDVSTPEAIEGYHLVAYSMLVPERPTWMPLGRALYVKLGVALDPASTTEAGPDSDAALDLRDALRTLNAATPDEMAWATACHLGVDTSVVANRMRKLDDYPERGRTALYRHFDCDGRLLYVGIAADPEARRKQHQRTSRWARLSDEMTVEWFGTRAEAEASERDAIASERPIFNTTHAGREAKERAIDYLLARVATH